MACNHLDHNYNCNCDKDGNIIPIEISDDLITGYNGLYAAIPDNDILLNEFNGYIQQYGGLDKVCEIFPYINLELNRYGIFVPENNNQFSKFSNLYHIMKAKRRDEASEYKKVEVQQRASATIPHQMPTNAGYVPANVDVATRSKEDEQFEITASNVFVSREEDPIDKEQVIGFASKNMVEGEKKEEGYVFHCNRIGNLEPRGGLSNFNPTWHPNDPKNYPVQQPPIAGVPTAPFQAQSNYYQTPGFVNENVANRESFFSLSKLTSDKMMNNQNWRPNNLVLKNSEFPEGVDEKHTDFERIRQQMKFDCFGPESEMAQSGIPKANPYTGDNIIDTGDPESYEFMFDGNDDEVANALLEEQFGRRNAEYKSASNNAQRYAAMNMMPPKPAQIGNPYFMNNPWLQSHQAQMGGMAGGYYGAVPGMIFPTMNNGPQYFQTNNEWMLPTEEEIRSGEIPLVTVVRGEIDKDEEIAPIRKKSREEDIKFAIVRTHTDENGMEYDEFLYGDREVANEKPNKNSLDYKEAATIAKRSELEIDTYALAKELARYNSLLADNLLWYKDNVDNEEFMEIRREAQRELMKYRSDDKLSNIKSTVVIAGDKTMILPPKPTTMQELERIAMEELSGHKTQKDKEDSIIDRYRNVNSPINTQRRAIMNGNSVKEIITKLQALTDMRINCGDEEIKTHEQFSKHDKDLSPIKINERDNYLTWKRLMKSAKSYINEDITNFDEKFDEWWNKPRVTTPDQKREQFKKYQIQMTELSIEHYNRIQQNAQSPEQKEQTYVNAVIKSWRDYDKGVITPDMSLYDFLDNANFLLTRNIEVQIERDSNKASRLYDPNAYLAEVRKHSAIRNMQDGLGFVPTMDLMDHKVYQQKRQDFINQIFKKANRGTIT
jgi:hypothetical protein